MRVVNKAVDVLVPPLLGFFVVFVGLLASSGFESVFYEEWFPHLQGNKLVSLIIDVCIFALISFLFVLLAKWIYKDTRILGFSLKGFFKKFFTGYLIGAVLVALMTAGYVLFDGADFSLIVARTSWSQVLTAAVFYLAQGTQEEVISRGFVLGGVAKRTSLFWGILISSLFFMLMHLSNAGGFTISLLDYFLTGLAFALMRVAFSNTWIAAAAHGAYNFFMADVFGLAASVPESEGIVFQTIYHSSIDYMSMTVSLIAVVILFVWLWPRRKQFGEPLQVEK